MTQAWQHEIYLPHWYYMLEEWANNLRIIPLGWHRRMAWWHRCYRSSSHNESWPEKIDSLAKLPKCVDALFGWSANTGVLQRGWPASHTLAHPHSLSLNELEHNLKFQGKPEYDFPNRMVRFWQIQSSPAARVDDGDRANLHPSGVWAREGKDRG
jgi:hypothetical protein